MTVPSTKLVSVSEKIGENPFGAISINCVVQPSCEFLTYAFFNNGVLLDVTLQKPIASSRVCSVVITAREVSSPIMDLIVTVIPARDP